MRAPVSVLSRGKGQLMHQRNCPSARFCFRLALRRLASHAAVKTAAVSHGGYRGAYRAVRIRRASYLLDSRRVDKRQRCPEHACIIQRSDPKCPRTTDAAGNARPWRQSSRVSPCPAGIQQSWPECSRLSFDSPRRIVAAIGLPPKWNLWAD